jgi:hypothetical protein
LKRGRRLRRALGACAAALILALLGASAAAAASPTVVINQAASQADPTSGSTIAFEAVFSEAVSGFDGADILFGGTATGPLTAVVTGGPTTYTVTVSGMTDSGTVTASIPAGAANATGGTHSASLASTSTDNKVTWVQSTMAPAVTIDAASGQPDPATTAPIYFVARFSEAVSGFTAADVSFAGSTAAGPSATVLSGPTDYVVAVSGMTGAGTVVATIPAGAAVDASGYASTASTSTDNSVLWQPSAIVPPPLMSTLAPTSPAAKPSLTLLSKCTAKHPCATTKSGRAISLRVACSAAAPCTGTATLTVGKQTLGKTHVNLSAGAKSTLHLPLSARAAALLESKPNLRATLTTKLGTASRSWPVSVAGVES